jgi:hypothetical protein
MSGLGKQRKIARAALQPKGIDYHGHFLEKSGANWWNPGLYAALLSPSEDRVALNSGEDVASYPGPFDPDRIRSEGKYWIDIYDVGFD